MFPFPLTEAAKEEFAITVLIDKNRLLWSLVGKRQDVGRRQRAMEVHGIKMHYMPACKCFNETHYPVKHALK